MKLWLISQNVNVDYDTYDSAVVAAPDDMAARLCHPANQIRRSWGFTEPHVRSDRPLFDSWAPIEDVEVEYIGEGDHEAGTVICASFNAG